MCFEVKYGMGRHSENVTAAESLEQLKVRISSYNMTDDGLSGKSPCLPETRGIGRG